MDIAAELNEAVTRRVLEGGPGRMTVRVLAEGSDWSVSDVLCTSGPQDRPFEEKHPHAFIGMVMAGSFEYQTEAGCDLLTPGSLMLGNAEQCFECRHEVGTGDRCLSFAYAPAYFERLAADAGVRGHAPGFEFLRVPPLPALAPVVARACAGLAVAYEIGWEEVSVEVATRSVRLAHDLKADTHPVSRSAQAGVIAALRVIEYDFSRKLTLRDLAHQAGLSPYHFLRAFERVIGVTPHQFLLRMRLRDAAMRLARGPTRILDVAFDCGFSDVSNFNHAFGREFGVTPRAYQARSA